MTAAKPAKPVRFRAKRREILPFIGVALLGLMTLAGAAGNVVMARPALTAQQRWAAEKTDLDAARRARIAALQALPTDCTPAPTHELVKLLAQDGNWPTARMTADTYTLSCGTDPVVHAWGYAPHAHAPR